MSSPERTVSRRSLLAGGAGLVVAAGAARAAGSAGAGALRPTERLRSTVGFGNSDDDSVARALAALGRTTLRRPGDRPFPDRPAGTDCLPGIDHIVVVMLENHSYDNLLGMLGRGRGERRRGDGFRVDHHGRPTAHNPYPGGHRVQHAFHMPTTCQLHSKPSQEWTASHVQYANGRMNGFVKSDSGPVAMGYWTGQDLPFTYDLARKFPIGDRWFSSLLGQTDPNRRFLIAGTSSGMTDDIGTGAGNAIPDATLPLPAGGTLFTSLTEHGISWTDYCASYPLGCTANLYPTPDGPLAAKSHKSLDAFFADARSGNLPAFSLVDMDYGTQSQENPQNIVVGEALLHRVVTALGHSPLWHSSMLIVTYDEHGGYYDHVPPPVALAPDNTPPTVQPGESTYDGFRRYGFRVPSIVVSPYARRHHVTHRLHDHTSVLAMVERKWNLPALTYRDANAHDLTDFLDLHALARRRPTFRRLPHLHPPGDTKAALHCSTAGPGQIPPRGSISHRR